MVSEDESERTIAKFVEVFSEEELVKLLRSKLVEQGGVLTIIADQSLHKIPDDLVFGDVYVFSSGNLEAGSDEVVKRELVQRLKALHHFLKSKRWRAVRLIFTGHALLAAHIKLTVYRVLHLDTIDIGYFGKDGYREVSIDFRRDIAQ